MRSLRISCVQTVDSFSKSWGQNLVVFHTFIKPIAGLWKSGQFIRVLYTKCVQFLTAVVDNFTSVISSFYTLSTWSTKPTTKYIYIGV